ncbi:MAG: Gfo/Idh/MocA family oxidoreductase [Candidatus Kapaibacterium sp.]
MKVGVIGTGYWGPNIIRNFLSNKNIIKVYSNDLDIKRLQNIKNRFPEIEIIKDGNELIKNNDIDIIAISTPVDSHFLLAKSALEEGKHIWVEKPFMANSKEAEEIIEISEKKNLKVFVDHTFIYTGSVMKMKEIIDSGDLGNIYYFDSVRINLGLFQSDVNVIWDLAPHDLSIMKYVLPQKIVAVAANGIANYYQQENIAHISVYFENNCFAHFHINWTSPVKIRKMIAGGDKKMLVFDDMENIEKIKIYDSGVNMNNKQNIYDALVQYRIGDMYSPKVNQTEALSLGVSEFINSILENRIPLTNAYDGLEVVKILEAANKSIKNKGKLIAL